MSPGEAFRRGLAEGDLAEISSARGKLRARVRVARVRDGVLFVPFHYGYFDAPHGAPARRQQPGRAANEATITAWDPASKQPLFKTCAAAITVVERASDAPGATGSAPTTAASAPVGPTADQVPPTVGGPDALSTSTRGER